MVHLYTNHAVFLSKYEHFFINDEIKYGLILGISKRNKGITLMVSSEIDDRFVVGVLAGKNLIVASNTMEEDVYHDLVSYMEHVDYPGIIGVKEHCEIYHSKYKEITGKQLVTKMDQRIYYCSCVNELSEKVGVVRLARDGDVANLVDWAYHFLLMMEESASIEEAKKHIEHQIMNKTLFVLEIDNQLVSMAARSRALYTTESVGFVYTPPAFRRNGYARRVVEEVTKSVLSDKRIASLYTDLSNPTSNSIYMNIGYKPYCDSIMLCKF